MQAEVFLQGEADAYHQRNRGKYAAMVEKDPVLSVITAAQVRPTCALEIGCATGWRLEEIRRHYSARCWGVDPSQQAIEEGRCLYPQVNLHRGLLNSLALATAGFDLIVLSFVLHWVDRAELLKLLAEVDRLLAEEGHLIISDFLPSHPTKVPYHHKDGLWTYKARYDDILKATGCYETAMAMLFDVETLRECYTVQQRQAKCTLLQKGDFYRCE